MSLLNLRRLLMTTLLLVILLGGWSIRPALGRQAIPAPPEASALAASPDGAELAMTTAVRGEVTLQGRADHAGITILADGRPVATTDSEGSFVVPAMAAGSHLLAAQMPGYLAAATGEIELVAGQAADVVFRPVALLAGDVNGDGRVNVFDLGMVSSGSPAADLNDDGEVNLLDMVLVTGNYGRSAPIVWSGVAPSANAARPPQDAVPGDVDGDGVVGNSDLVVIATAYGSEPPSDPRADLNLDGMVSLTDLLFVADHYGQTASDAAAVAQPTPTPVPASPSAAPACTVTAYALNVREGPGTCFRVLTAVPRGTPLELLARDKDGYWIQVSAPGSIEGWVASAYVTCNVPISEVGVAENIPLPAATPVPAYWPPHPVPLPPVPAIPAAKMYPAPVLVLPNNGDTFEDEVPLRWTWSGTLGPNEHFDVQVWRPGETPHGVAWSDTTSWSGPLLGPRGARLWRIVVIRGHDGQWEADLSAPSEERFFNWLFPRGEGRSAPDEPEPVDTAAPPPEATQTPESPPEATETPEPPEATATEEPYPPEPTEEPTGYPPSAALPAAVASARQPAPGTHGQLPLAAALPALGVMVALGYRRRR